MRFRTLVALLCAVGFLAGVSTTTACGGTGDYVIPVAHPLVRYKKPARTDLVDEPVKAEPENKTPPPDMGDDDDGASTPPATKNPCAP